MATEQYRVIVYERMLERPLQLQNNTIWYSRKYYLKGLYGNRTISFYSLWKNAWKTFTTAEQYHLIPLKRIFETSCQLQCSNIWYFWSVMAIAEHYNLILYKKGYLKAMTVNWSYLVRLIAIRNSSDSSHVFIKRYCWSLD
jgi:hypothetical protein